MALSVGALFLLAPFFVLLNAGEQDEFVTVVACYLQDLNELFEDVGAWSYSQLTRTLERTTFVPLLNAAFAEKFPAVVTVHYITRYLQTNSTNQLIFELVMHLAIEYSLDVVAST